MVDGSSIAIGADIQEVSAEAVSGVQPQAFSSPGKPPARNLVNPASASRTRLRLGVAILRRFVGISG